MARLPVQRDSCQFPLQRRFRTCLGSALESPANSLGDDASSEQAGTGQRRVTRERIGDLEIVDNLSQGLHLKEQWQCE